MGTGVTAFGHTAPLWSRYYGDSSPPSPHWGGISQHGDTVWFWAYLPTFFGGSQKMPNLPFCAWF